MAALWQRCKRSECSVGTGERTGVAQDRRPTEENTAASSGVGLRVGVGE